jgi:hypothetical protein
LITTVTPEAPGIPRAMVLTVSFALSPVTGLVCHRHLRNTFRKLDTSVGASGPHDFVVRVQHFRPARICARLTPPRPPHPAPNVRDDRDTPLLWDGMAGVVDFESGQARSGIFLRLGMDSILLICPSGKSPVAIAKQSPKFHIDVKADFLCSRQEFGQIEHLPKREYEQQKQSS